MFVFREVGVEDKEVEISEKRKLVCSLCVLGGVGGSGEGREKK